MFTTHGFVSAVARFAFVPFVVVAAIVAVPAAAQTVPKPPTDGGSMRGRIFDADSGQLITEGLTIESMLDVNGFTSGSRQINIAGEFAFSDLQAGLYQLRIREKGNPFPIVATRKVQVAAGAMIRSDIYLRLPGKIDAVVVDSSGEPVQGSTVMLVNSGYSRGHAVYTFATQIKTDDRGHGTFPNKVLAGHQYFLLALPPEASNPTLSGTPSLEAVWSPGHPGAWQPFVLRSAEQKQIDLVMQRSPTHCVDGSLTGDGIPAALDFEIAIPEVAGYVGLTGGTRGVIFKGRSDESGHFHVCGLWKGDFVLAAGLNKEFYGRSTISMVDKDLRDIKLGAHSPISLSVAIHRDVESIPEQTFLLQFIPSTRVAFESQPFLSKSMTGVVPSKFTVSLLPFTDYDIGGGLLLPGTPGPLRGGYIKEVKCDSAIYRNTLKLDDAPCHLDVTIGTDMGSLAATFVDKDNNPDSNSSVCLYSISAATGEQIEETGTCSMVDDPGTASALMWVRPGRYRAVVVPPDTSDWVEYILAVRGQGELIEIVPRSTLQLTLKTSPAH